MHGPAVHVLAVEVDILQRQVRAAGNGDEPPGGGMGGRVPAAPDLRSGGVAGAVSGEDVAVLRGGAAPGGGKGQRPRAGICHRRGQGEVLQRLQLQGGMERVVCHRLPVLVHKDLRLSGGEARLQRGIDGREEPPGGLGGPPLPDLMPLRIEQLVAAVRQLADGLAVGNDVVSAGVLTQGPVVLRSVGRRIPFRQGGSQGAGRIVLVLQLDRQPEHPVALDVVGAPTAAVPLGVGRLQKIVGAQGKLAEIDHALGKRLVVHVLEAVAPVRGADRVGIALPVAAPALQFREPVGEGLPGEFGIDRKGRIGQGVSETVHLHEPDLVVAADIGQAHIVGGDVGREDRLAAAVQGEDPVVFSQNGGVAGDQGLGVGNVQRPVVLPQVLRERRVGKVRGAHQHQIGGAVFLEAAGALGLLHVIGPDGNGGKLHPALFHQVAPGVGVRLPVGGDRARAQRLGAREILIEGEARAGHRHGLVVDLLEGDDVHLVPVDVGAVAADPHTAEVFAVGAAGNEVGQGVAEMAQAGGADGSLRRGELIVGPLVGVRLRPDPDRVAGQLAGNVDGGRVCLAGIARQVDVLAHVVQNAAVGDPRLVGEDIAAEFRAAGEVQEAALLQVDAGARGGLKRGAGPRGVAVLGEFRAAAEVHRHRALQVDRAALVGVAAADHRAVRDAEGASRGLHINRAAAARGRAGVDAGLLPVRALFQGQRPVVAVDRASVSCVAGGGAVGEAGAGDAHGGAFTVVLAVQRAAVVGGRAVGKAAARYFDRNGLGIHRAAIVIGGVRTGGSASRKGGVGDGGPISAAGRLVVAIHIPVIDCATIRRGLAIPEGTGFHAQAFRPGLDRAAVSPVVPGRRAILKHTVSDGR